MHNHWFDINFIQFVVNNTTSPQQHIVTCVVLLSCLSVGFGFFCFSRFPVQRVNLHLPSARFHVNATWPDKTTDRLNLTLQISQNLIIDINNSFLAIVRTIADICNWNPTCCGGGDNGSPLVKNLYSIKIKINFWFEVVLAAFLKS